MDGKRKKTYVERVVNDIMDELDQGTTEQEICQGGMDCDNYPEEWEEVDNRQSNKMQKKNDYDSSSDFVEGGNKSF